MNILLIIPIIAVILAIFGRVKESLLYLRISEILFFLYFFDIINLFRFPQPFLSYTPFVLFLGFNTLPLVYFFGLVLFFTVLLYRLPKFFNPGLLLLMYLPIVSVNLLSDGINIENFSNNNHIYIAIASLTAVSALLAYQTIAIEQTKPKIYVYILIILNALIYIFGVIGFVWS